MTRIFFAYGSGHGLAVEAMQTAAERMKQSGLDALTWQDMQVDGRILFDTIATEISKSDVVVAEISDLNPNVLFEVGYALALNKSLVLAYDETRGESERNWRALKITATLGRTQYTGDGNKLADLLLRGNVLSEGTGLTERLLQGARGSEENAVFAPTPDVKIQPVETLGKYLGRQGSIKLLAASEELIIAPLSFYFQEIFRSAAAILHLLGPDRRNALGYNARMSLFAGFSHGLGIRTVMVAEESLRPSLDYADLFFNYNSSAQLVSFVSDWLDRHPQDVRGRRRLGKLEIITRLPVQTFGRYVAEDEVRELPDYFVQTQQFGQLLENRSSLFIGRKGTGKTATMSQAVAELRRDSRNLVVPIKPASYEFSGLIDVLHGVSEGDQDYFLVRLWEYLLITEVAQRTIKHAQDRGAGAGGSPALGRLSDALESLGVGLDMDMPSRLDHVISIRDDLHAGGPWHEEAARMLKVGVVTQLEGAIREALDGFERVAVVIDNLDKGWDKGSDFLLVSRFILTLLTVRGRLQSRLHRATGSGSPVNLTVSLFIRTDIYDELLTHAREPDKINGLTVRWDDGEMLARVLEERYVAKARGGARRDSIWQDLFCEEVRGLPTRDYLLWRALPRPRDMIFFANEAVAIAINRDHAQVAADDVLYAERQYSRFACEALYVESVATAWDIEDVCYQFAGRQSTLPEAELTELLEAYDHPKELRDWLVQSSFLGLEEAQESFTFVEGSKEARRVSQASSRWASTSGQARRFRVHPAFRAELRVIEDDLHGSTV